MAMIVPWSNEIFNLTEAKGLADSLGQELVVVHADDETPPSEGFSGQWIGSISQFNLRPKPQAEESIFLIWVGRKEELCFLIMQYFRDRAVRTRVLRPGPNLGWHLLYTG